MPQNGYKMKLYRITPPDMQAYFDENRIAYAPIPPHNPACEKIFVEGAPVIRFPVSGTEYLISKQEPEPLQLDCNVTGDVKTVYWYINNKFYKQAKASEKLFFKPTDGPVKISCTDDKGRNTDITIKVRYVNL